MNLRRRWRRKREKRKEDTRALFQQLLYHPIVVYLWDVGAQPAEDGDLARERKWIPLDIKQEEFDVMGEEREEDKRRKQEGEEMMRKGRGIEENREGAGRSVSVLTSFGSLGSGEQKRGWREISVDLRVRTEVQALLRTRDVGVVGEELHLSERGGDEIDADVGGLVIPACPTPARISIHLSIYGPSSLLPASSILDPLYIHPMPRRMPPSRGEGKEGTESEKQRIQSPYKHATGGHPSLRIRVEVTRQYDGT
ncbi:hypothetical protein B0H19DRAFT_1084165 [Mycena capillaripes]|nr:hypothetical protein B0H19DRAFT_1084165 [Mycena capillaripes]